MSLRKALSEVEQIDPPAIGLSKATGLGAASANTVLIKQNNTIIQLLRLR